MSKRKRHAPVYEGEQSATKRLWAPDEMEIGPTSSRGSFSQTELVKGALVRKGIEHGEVGNEELQQLSVKIGISWKPLARRLRLEEAEITGIDKENVTIREKAYAMFLNWKGRDASAASYGVLYDALSHDLVARRDLAEKFCIGVTPSLNFGPTSSRGSFLQPEDLPGVRRIKHGLVFDDELEFLSVGLGEGWKRLARRLGFTVDQIEAIDKDNQRLSVKAYKMLMIWRQREGPQATYQVLHDALVHKLVQHKALAEVLCIDDGRPFLDPIPSEIIAQGPRGVLAFKNALKNGKAKVYRGRIMFVGQDRAGKTSLKNSFLGLPFVPTQQSTDGIDVDRSKCEYDVDQVKNLKLTDERFGISQHLNDIARMAAKEIKEAATKALSHDTRELDVPKETNHDGDEVPGDVEENSKTKQAHRDGDNARARPTNEIPELSFDPAVPPDEFRLLLEQYLEDVNLLSDANTEANHITLDLWDFAGQDLYYASYPAFLSPRAVYMLVCNLSKGLKQTAQPCVRQGDQDIKLKNPNQETNIENLLSWLASICSLRSSKQVLDETEAIREGLNHLRPPVFIVGTHADTPFEEVEEMLSQIRTEISETRLNCHVIDCCAVDNKMGPSDERLVALKERMIEVLNKEPYMGEEIPIGWLNFERVISALTERNVDYLNVEEVQVIAREKCFITNEKEFDLMMNFYHDLGIIVKHGTTVILNAKWLIELFRKLITIPKSNEMDPVTRNHWNKLQRTGILSTELVDRIFKQFFLKGVVKNDILSLMEHFGLIAKFSTSSCDAENSENYFVPAQMIAGIESLPDIEPLKYDPCPLYIDFCTGFVPHGLFAQIVSRSIRWVSEMTVRRKTSTGCNPLRKRVKSEATPDIKLSQNGACFIIRRNVAHRLKLICEKRFIKILLKKERKAQQSLEDSSNEIAAQVLEFLEKALQDLSEKFRYLHGLQYRLCVACPSCVVEDLVDIEDMSCTVSQDSVVVDGAEQWLTRTTEEECVSPLPGREQRVPDNIKEGQPNEIELELLSTKLEEWEPLGRQLGFEGGDLTAVHKDNDKWFSKIFEMLKKWKQRTGKDATYRVLYHALCYTTVGRKDLAQTFCCHQLQETCISTE